VASPAASVETTPPDPARNCRSLRAPVKPLRGSSARKLAAAPSGDRRPPLPGLTATGSGGRGVAEGCVNRGASCPDQLAAPIRLHVPANGEHLSYQQSSCGTQTEPGCSGIKIHQHHPSPYGQCGEPREGTPDRQRKFNFRELQPSRAAKLTYRIRPWTSRQKL